MKRQTSTSSKLWSGLEAEVAILAALDHAGVRPADDENQNVKRAWSERFANGCAVALSQELRRHRKLRKKRIRPENLETGTEPLTPLGAATNKRIDVTVADELLGLEIGLSLKGFNFKDGKSNNYDKNLTGRLYELGDEMRLIHEHLPHAFMVGILFLPLGSTGDKTPKAESSFARAMMKLRDRTGRVDHLLHTTKCDSGYVGLYVIGDEADGYTRGACRFVNVASNPPRRGRPPMVATLSLSQVVEQIVRDATRTSAREWGEAETDDAS